MSISYLLVFLGLVAFGGAAWAMFWAVDAGQYDDLESQGAAILDDPPDLAAASPVPEDPAVAP